MIKQRVYELLLKTSAHGLPRLLISKNILIKLLWTFILICSAGAGSYFSIKTILEYIKYETLTNIDLIEEHLIEFPALSICGLPQLSLNNSLNDSIMKLRINRKNFENYSHYFFPFNDTTYGPCYRFNSGKNYYGENVETIKANRAGLPFGIRIDANFHLQDNYDFRQLIIYFHNRSSPPLDLYDGGFWITAGSYYFFQIEQVHYRNLEEPYSNCIKDINNYRQNRSIIDYILSKNRNYRQSDCFHICEQLSAIENSSCNCSPKLDDFDRECVKQWFESSTNNKKLCIEEYLIEFRTKRHIDCLKYCPLECDTQSYLISLYTDKFPISGNISYSSKITNGMPKFDTYEDMNKNFFNIIIYYKELKYPLISQNAKLELFTCISNIGGTLSLFFGISFISFFEIIEILIEVMLILLKNKKFYF